MQINMIWFTLALLIVLLITRVITLETFQMNLATLTLIIIMIVLLFSSLSIQYVNGSVDYSSSSSNIPMTTAHIQPAPQPSFYGPSSNLHLF